MSRQQVSRAGMVADVIECITCGGDVFWAKTIDGKKIAIDAATASDGNIALEEQFGALIAHVLSLGALKALAGDRFRSHFATCREREQRRSAR